MKPNQGSRNNYSKLTESQVFEIRFRYRITPGLTYVMLAKEYNVDMTTIGDVVTRKTWRHV